MVCSPLWRGSEGRQLGTGVIATSCCSCSPLYRILALLLSGSNSIKQPISFFAIPCEDRFSHHYKCQVTLLHTSSPLSGMNKRSSMRVQARRPGLCLSNQTLNMYSRNQHSLLSNLNKKRFKNQSRTH